MSIAKTGAFYNSYKYITMAIDEYNDFCLKGMLFHVEKEYGIPFANYLEMLFFVNRIYDDICYPKQAVIIRSFSCCKSLEMAMLEEENEKEVRLGSLATCHICLKYRQNGSWQGSLTWHDEQKAVEFKSVLELIGFIDKRLKDIALGNVKNKTKTGKDISENGWVGKLTEAYQKKSTGVFKMTVAKGKVTVMEANTANNNIISETYWSAYHKIVKETTFIVKILYREHHSWQGVICWREKKEKAAYRSFFELLNLIVSAMECGSAELRAANEADRHIPGNIS